MPGTRLVSAIRLAARIIILEGTHPKYGHSPPTRRDSTPVTCSPASASVPATYSPPGPRPSTTTSVCSGWPMPDSCPVWLTIMRPRPGQAYLFTVIDAQRAKGGAGIPGKDYFYDRDRLAPYCGPDFRHVS